jgi:hypothetical protein
LISDLTKVAGAPPLMTAGFLLRSLATITAFLG